MTAPIEAVQAVEGLLNCWADGEWCGVCTAAWGPRGCVAAVSIADTVWAMAAHCDCTYCSGETTASGECGCDFCDHRRANDADEDESCQGCEECGDGPMLGSCCFNVGTPECRCKRKTDWGKGTPPVGRPSTDLLLGIAPDWTEGRSVDDYIRDQRRR